MSRTLTLRIFLSCLIIAILLVFLVHGLALEVILSDPQRLFIIETIMYLTGLGALFFGWRLIDHKFPGKTK